MLQLTWGKCEGGEWCPFQTVNLNSPHFDNLEGVYIIWHGGQSPATVRVGQGVIRDRIQAHRNDPAILAYAQYGLFVTWANVAPPFRDGIERYLAETLGPKVGAAFPQAPPIQVNLPWR